MSAMSITSPPRLHHAARIEDRAHVIVERGLRTRGWAPRVIGFTGYGNSTQVRVLARVLLAPPGTTTGELRLGRGWRRFLTATARDVPVRITLGGKQHTVPSGRGGYIDTVLPASFTPGWAEAELEVEGSPVGPVRTPLRIFDQHGLGVISDIDDTVIITALPRPLLAAWNTFVRHETSRRPVPGMATLLSELSRHHGDVPVVYISTGPWNVAPVLEMFLRRHGFPPGPLLMTDWGPTPERWFRSGRDHKRRELRRLFQAFPEREWLLLGDDGQHDPQIYGEIAAAFPDQVRAVAIRQLSFAEQVRTHGSPQPLPEGEEHATPAYDEVRAPDGFRLLAELRAHELVLG
jgi:phosphatidate phosphatase APP1